MGRGDTTTGLGFKSILSIDGDLCHIYRLAVGYRQLASIVTYALILQSSKFPQVAFV